jgi:ribosome-associated protein
VSALHWPGPDLSRWFFADERTAAFLPLGHVVMGETDKTMTETPQSTPAQATAERKRRRAHHELQDQVPHSAVTRTTPERVRVAQEHAGICARIAEDNRGKDILLLDLRKATPLVDFFVIVTATSRRQSHAIASEIDQEMKRIGEHKLGIEGSEEGRWILIDYGDFVVHIFSAEARTYYALEEIWGDAPQLDWQKSDQRSAISDQPEDRST